MENIKTQKHQKSITGKKCLGPCYTAGTSFTHPAFLTNIKNDFYPGKSVCPTTRYEIVDEVTNKTHQLSYDICTNATHDKNVSDVGSLIYFQSGFTKDIFLSFYYNINSFEDAIMWIQDNNFTPLETRERIINTALNLFGDSINHFDDIFTKFYIEYIKNKHIGDIYKELYKYIGMVDNSILVVKSNNKLSFDDHQIERKNYIIETFFNIQNVDKFLIKYLKAKSISFADYNDVLYLIFIDNLAWIRKTIES